MIQLIREQFRTHRQLILLLMLIMLTLAHPLLEHGLAPQLILAVLMVLTLLVATLAVSQKKGWFWLPLLILAGAVLLGIAAAVTSHWVLLLMQWTSITVFFAVVIIAQFSYIRDARTIQKDHLYTAASIYLLMAMMWFALYNVIEAVHPGSFMRGTTILDDPRTELLYFSLVTLTTVGYGDIVPVGGVTRILAALEAGTGVLYVAIAVAIVVSAHNRRGEK